MSTILPLSFIRCDGGTQPRQAIDEAVVSEYAERLTEGDTFPPVTVYYDGSAYWLADGFHRVAGHDAAGLDQIACEVLQGTRRDAVLHSVGANSTHGLPRTNADKRRAVLVLLGDSEWSGWSDREIARRCKVDHKTVARLREELTPTLTGEIPSEPRTYTTKHGTTATMNVGGIQEAAKERAAPAIPASAETHDTEVRREPEPASVSTLQPKWVNTHRLTVFIAAAIDAAHAAEGVTDEQISTLTANDLMLAGLRKARDLTDRIIRQHSAGAKSATA